MTKPLALIIEDDPRLSQIFAMALNAAEFDTMIVDDGRAAVAQLADITPALIILDLHLPYVSGPEVLRQIKTDKRFTQTRIMVTTADPLTAEQIRPDVNLVLLKPISFSQLRDLANRLRPHE